ncbi:MAG: hypothetical protein ACWGSQ_15630 [Longimicrobiales bacterium]
MKENHQPDPEFVSHLEWQVRTALRREQRFARPVQSRSGRRMKIATLVLVSALVGAGGVVVKDEVQEARQQELLLAEVRGNLRLAEMEMELISRQYEQVEERYQGGLVPREAILNAGFALLRAETRLQRLKLDEEEILATGREARDGLSAPLVGGRDLVSERLELDRSVALQEVTAARAQLEHLQERYESGLLGDADLMDGLVPIQQAEARVEELDQRLELRQEVLDGTVTGEEAERQVELSQVRGEMDVLEQAWEGAVMRVRAVEERASQGLLDESQLLAARFHLLQLETRMEVLRLRLEILEEGGPGTGSSR